MKNFVYLLCLLCLSACGSSSTSVGNGSFSVSGKVKFADNNALAGATVTFTGTSSGTATTASDGTYSFTGVNNGVYQVTAAKTGYVVTPAAISLTVSNTNLTGKDFTATPASYAIAGTISVGGAPLPGVSVTLPGTSVGAVTTDASGNYSLSVTSGTYSLAASLAGYVFTPASLSATVNNADVTGKNFTATYQLLAQNWEPASLLEIISPEEVKESEVAIDEVGNAVVVWYQNGKTWAARYSALEAQWGLAEVIAPDHRIGTFAFSSEPHVAADGSGNAMVVWVDPGGNPWKIWGMRFSLATGAWEPPVLIETNDASGISTNPRVLADALGNFTATWVQEDRSVWPFRTHIWASRYSAASKTWGVPHMVDTAFYSQSAGGYLQASVDGSGNVMAVWSELNGTVVNAWAARYSTSNDRWETPVLLKTNTMSGAYDLQVAMDGNGNAVAVWVEDDSNTGVVYSRRYVWMNRYFADTGQWGLSIMIPAVSSGDMFNPQVVLDGKGNATIVGAAGAFSVNRLWTTRYDFIHDSFLVPRYLTQDQGINSKLAADWAGNELCVYVIADGHSTLQTLGFNAGTAVWQTAKQVSDSGWSGGNVKLAANRNGNAVTAWVQSDGLTYHLWASVLK